MRSALILAVILAALPVGAADLRLHECRTLPGYLYTLTEAEYDNLSRAASEMGSKGVKPFTHTKQAFFLEPDLKVWASEPTADGKIKVRLFGTNQVYWTTQRASIAGEMNEQAFAEGLQDALKTFYGKRWASPSWWSRSTTIPTNATWPSTPRTSSAPT